MMRLVALFFAIAPALALGLALAAQGAAPDSAPNPVTNGSFEAIGPDGIPADWQFVGPGKLSDDAHTGKHAVLFDSAAAKTSRELGLNRTWKQGSGQQGKMLSQLKGGFRFWYKVLRATPDAALQFQVIPMDAQPLERTGERRASFEIPHGEGVNGQWRQGAVAYDFTANPKAKWIHVGPRVKGGAALLIDDVEWVESIGPYPQVRTIRLYEPPGAARGQRIVEAVIDNAGDRPLDQATATLSLPPALRCNGSLSVAAPPLKPGTGGKVKWAISGRYESGARIAATVACGESSATAETRLSPRLVVEQLRADRFILDVGETTTLTLAVRNKGTAIGGGVTARLQVPPEVELISGPKEGRVDAIEPGGAGECHWRLRAVGQAPAAVVRCHATMAGGQAADVTSELAIIHPLAAKPPLLAISPLGGASPKIANAIARGSTQVSEDGVLVENRKVRLWMPRTEFGYGLADLQTLTGVAWQTVARLSRLGRAVVKLSGGKRQNVFLFADDVRSSSAAALHLSRHWRDDDGTTWAFQWTVAPNPRFPDLIDFTVSAVADRPARLLCFEGPMLRVGEGSFGGAQDQALFPGLEWLVAGESSSSDLDIGENHPDRVRLVPPPTMVTVPLMTLWRDGVAVGLLWDHLKPYYGSLNRPSAVFASPNRFDGHNNTLMGLFAPSMSDYVPANDRIASAPLELKPGAPVTLEAHLYATGEAKDALSAVDRWFALYGVPEPQRLPHGKTYADEFSFSTRGYLDSGWIANEQKWFSSKSPNPMRAKPVLPSAYLYDTLRCGELGSNPITSALCRERCDLVKTLLPQPPQPPAAEDMGFDLRGALAGAGVRAKEAAALMASMNAEGAWTFDDRVENAGIFKGKDYGLLGLGGVAEAGTCAAKAHAILRYARMTDDPQAKAAGLKALRFMDRFTVPRAAQVWEVPFHTPDILASAQACEAYLEGYEITGDKRHLDKAVYWARTGLPFLYTWDAPGCEFLRYASIPVFGATWYNGSWFGRPVQWNGIVYAWAVLKLARHDNSYPWRRIAEGVTRSCMWQQVTEKPQDVALWPDWIRADNHAYSENLLFLPRRMLIPLYALAGMEPEPRTLRLSRGEQIVCVNACAALSDGAWDGERLRFAAAWHPVQAAGYLSVVNVAEPREVTVDGKALGRNDRAGASRAGWFYSAEQAALEIHLRDSAKAPAAAPAQGSETHCVEIAGVKYARAAQKPAP